LARHKAAALWLSLDGRRTLSDLGEADSPTMAGAEQLMAIGAARPSIAGVRESGT